MPGFVHCEAFALDRQLEAITIFRLGVPRS
jgi:hypothetical protein